MPHCPNWIFRLNRNNSDSGERNENKAHFSTAKFGGYYNIEPHIIWPWTYLSKWPVISSICVCVLCARGLLREETREINSYSFIFCVRSPVGIISFRISLCFCSVCLLPFHLAAVIIVRFPSGCARLFVFGLLWRSSRYHAAFTALKPNTSRCPAILSFRTNAGANIYAKFNNSIGKWFVVRTGTGNERKLGYSENDSVIVRCR